MNFLQLDNRLIYNRDVIESPNLCDRFTAEDRTKIGNAVFLGYQRDQSSRAKWMKRMEAAMDLAMQIQNPKEFPWPGCSNVIFPLVTIAALQFSARSYSNLIQGNNIVQYRTMGDDPGGALAKIAKRISIHMSWQVLEEDKSWEEEHDRLLINLGVVGTTFIKSFFSAKLGYNLNQMVMARDLVIDYWAKSVDEAARKTHIIPLYRNDIYERAMQGTFVDVRETSWFNSVPATPSSAAPGLDQQKQDNRQGVIPATNDEDTPYRTLEQHRFLDLDRDGYAEPYIATIEEGSHDLIRLVARVDREEQVDRNISSEIIQIRPTEYFTKYSFIPAIDGGIYDIGFGILLGPLNEAVNTGINQLLDGGTMANSSGGFLGRGAKIRGGVYTMAPWQWKRVDSTGDDLRKSLVPLPVREPSSVMYNLINLIIQYADRMSGSTDQMVGITPGQNTPAETSRNALEQGMQVYSTIFKRCWRSMKEEFKKNHRLNSVFLPMQKYFGTNKSMIRREDYNTNPDLVAPSADPTVSSMSMRFMKAQTVRQAAYTVPGYDVEVVERQFLEALQVEGIDQVYPGPSKMPPQPSPAAQVEQAKMATKKMQFQHELQLTVMKMMEERRINAAKILLLEAQAMKFAADAKDAQAASRLKAFEIVIDAMRMHNEALETRIKGIQALQGDDSEQSSSSDEASNSGGPGNMAPGSDNSGDSGSPPPVAASNSGPMGSGSVSESGTSDDSSS